MNRRLHRLLLSMVLLVSAVQMAGCGFFESADARRARAEELLGRGEYNEAMVELKNVLTEDPRDSKALMLVARANLQLGNLGAVEKALSDATTAGATAEEVATLRAQLLLRAGKHQELLNLLDGNARPEQTDTLRAQAFAGLGRCSEAVRIARQSLLANAADSRARIVVAECYARRGNGPRSLQELEEAVRVAPGDADAWMALGRTQQLLGRKADAERSWREAASHANGKLTVPQQALLYSALADLQVARRDLPAFRGSHEALLKLAPQALFTELIGARVLLMEDKPNDAVAALRRLATGAPELPAVHVLLASAYLTQGNLEQARLELSWMEQNAAQEIDVASAQRGLEAAASSPKDSAEYWLNVSRAQVALRQFDQARTALSRTAGLSPGSAVPRVALARLELQAGNTGPALDLAIELSKEFPDDGAIMALHADALSASGKDAEADAVLARLSARSPSGGLAIARHRLRVGGNLNSPDEPLEAWLKQNPRDIVVRAVFAESLRRAGDNRRAIAEYERLVADGPETAVVLNNLAWLYHLTGDVRAVATAKRAWQLAPKSAVVADTYGWILVEGGAVDQGAQILAEADAVAGVFQPEIRYHYVVALEKQGNRERARELLAELMAEDPQFSEREAASRLLARLDNPATT